MLKANYGSASESASGAADAVTTAGAEVDYALDKATVLFVGYSKINNSKNSKAYYTQADVFPQPALGKSPWDALHNSTRVCAVRIGMGRKAHFAANSACYWQEMQRRRPPEAALAQAVRGYAEHPKLLIRLMRGLRNIINTLLIIDSFQSGNWHRILYFDIIISINAINLSA